MSPRVLLLGVATLVRWVVAVAGYALAIGFLALFVLELFALPKLAHAPLMLRTETLLAPAIRWLSQWFGWHWPAGHSKNYAPLILAVAALVVRSVLDSMLLRVDSSVRRTFKKTARPRYDAQNAAPGQRQLSAETEQQRAMLLKRYRQIEDALKSASKKTCSFLSIDVVGSTKMKVGERTTAIDATFQAYEELVRHTFDACGVWKQTWTPDGVMACFLDRELAVSAAQQILSSLAQFNRSENQLRTPIAIRCGLNEGEVTIFEDSQLEKVADHSIDIAGHMQKYADEDTLQIADAFYEKLSERAGFDPTGREVDGFATYAWKPPVEAGIAQTAPIA
ncbi:MAG TPA: hypothetical protein VFN49_03035 [Candidatus Aquilonibacter sp.]|nr:hypothetical protein [Candidatus Aquilonibacter sp.]